MNNTIIKTPMRTIFFSVLLMLSSLNSSKLKAAIINGPEDYVHLMCQPVFSHEITGEHVGVNTSFLETDPTEITAEVTPEKRNMAVIQEYDAKHEMAFVGIGTDGPDDVPQDNIFRVSLPEGITGSSAWVEYQFKGHASGSSVAMSVNDALSRCENIYIPIIYSLEKTMFSLHSSLNLECMDIW